MPVSLQVPQHSQRINSIRSYINEQIDIALTSYNSYTTRASFDGHRYSYNNNLDNLFPVSSLIAQTVYSQKYLNTDEEGKLISITLLKDRIYQLYNKYLKLEERMIENAKQIAIRSAGDPNKFPGADAPTEAFWNTYFRLLYNCKKEFSGYAKEIPGFQAINEIDLDYLMRERCFFMYSLKITDLVIDNECYSIEDGIQLSKKWISVSFDSKLAEEAIKFHNRLKKFNLSKSQIALIFPIILTSPLSELFFLLMHYRD